MLPARSDSRGISRGATPILVATAVGGIAGYLITWLLPRELGFAPYATFAAFWGTLFLSVSALSGVQQEVTRSANEVRLGGTDRGPTPARVGLVLSIVTALAVVASAPLWTRAVFSSGDESVFVAPVAVGAASFGAFAVVSGALYASQRWWTIAGLLLTESLGRLLAVVLALWLDPRFSTLAWAVALPWLLALVVWAPRITQVAELRRGLADRSRVLVAHGTKTVVAATAMGALVSGLPAVLTATRGAASDVLLGATITVATLVRAPLIVVAMALQSLLVVKFSSLGSQLPRAVLGSLAAVLSAGAAIALLSFEFGGPLLAWALQDENLPSDRVIAALAGSSALLAAMFVTGSAALSRRLHSANVAGWLATAATTLVLLLAPLPFTTRVMAALAFPPLLGLAIHLTATVRTRPTETTLGRKGRR